MGVERELNLTDTERRVSAGALAYCLRPANSVGSCVGHTVLYLYLDPAIYDVSQMVHIWNQIILLNIVDHLGQSPPRAIPATWKV